MTPPSTADDVAAAPVAAEAGVGTSGCVAHGSEGKLVVATAPPPPPAAAPPQAPSLLPAAVPSAPLPQAPSSTPMPSSLCSKVRVGVRIRPLTAREEGEGGHRVLKVVQPEIRLGERRFTYDAVFDSDVSQSDLYQDVSPPLLRSFLDGYNATIMAYGQTGSGKTFTMGSEAHTELHLSSGTGLIPRFMNDMFAHLNNSSQQQQQDGNFRFELQASFLEVYGEDVHDLLDPARPSLPLREDANGGVVCSGLTQRPVSTADEALQVLHQGTLHRTTAATLMNLTSSRSHAVFCVTLTQHTGGTTAAASASSAGSEGSATTNPSHVNSAGAGGSANSSTSSITSRFTFVDLAGSERMKKTGAEGERAREGIKINEGLLALGNVINALADEERIVQQQQSLDTSGGGNSGSNNTRRKVHVPYRQSKLTRLLQDALGGNSQTLFLACVSPSDTNASETLSTLHYANRARNIRNAPTKNVDANAAEIGRLRSLVDVLERELVKSRFGGGVGACDGGEVTEDPENAAPQGQLVPAQLAVGDLHDESLLQRQDVLEYLSMVHLKAQEQQQQLQQHQLSSAVVAATAGSSLYRHIKSHALASSSGKNNRAVFGSVTNPPPPSPFKVGISSTSHEAGTPGTNPNNKSVMENYDPAFLAEVNPDEEMAILDQLLELQHRDDEFDEAQKRDTAELKQVEGELVKQENMLLQLRDSLKVYHDMKGKYESLMAEVQQLEVEKAQLAEQLEKAAVDPSKGCSKAIKKELAKVEKSLARARNETRKHRELYRKAEQEAKKCSVLERKITELKSGRAKLIKKQKEAASRHREYTQTKTREIMALKKKDRSNEQRLSKLQTEVQRQKKNLDKRQQYCSNLTAKLKKTEAHLMKLLSIRQRELHRDYRQSAAVGGASYRRRTSVFGATAPRRGDETAAAFAPPSQGLSSIQFLLDQVISDKVEVAELKSRYEDRVSGYSEAMRELVDAVRRLDQARVDKKAMEVDGDQNDGDDAVRDLEQTVEDLELKVELVGEELESLGMQLSSIEANGNCDSDLDNHERIKAIVQDKDAPTLRSVLIDTAQKFVQVQLHRNQLDRATQRKESIQRGLESEVELLNERIDSLTKELAQARSLQMSQQDPIETIKSLQAENTALALKLTAAEESAVAVKCSEDKLKEQTEHIETKLCEAKEQLALLESTKKQHECAASSAEEVLEKIQAIWRELGAASDQREEVRREIESSLDDTCSRKLDEAIELKQKTQQELDRLETELSNMKTSLGMTSIAEDASSATNPSATLFGRIEALRQLRDALEPTFVVAKERANSVRKQVEVLTSTIGLPDSDLADELKKLLDDATCSNNLNDDFLGRCEQHLSALRVRKSEMMVRNAELLKETFALVSDMNLSENQVLPLVAHSRRRRSKVLPDWWNEESAKVIAKAVSAPGGIVRVTCSFSNHLSAVHEALSSLAKGRRVLSTTLGDLIQRAQKTLLETVDGELDASEAYASFTETLFRLPPLSKELVHACIAEVNALLSGVDDMTQSEIEALTVVWEALDVSSSDRGKFWGEVDDTVTALETGSSGPFDEVVQSCLVDGEEWVLGVVRDATKSYRQLETRLFKLERIHKEVERLRTRQDAKSKIISLDAELRILSSKLSDFEHKQCSKQRLLTKKTGSSNLLKEERFRKQMQQKFTSKLEQLAKLLKNWRVDEKYEFDTNLLSDEVRLLLENPDTMEVCVEKRTEFMHLRTVKATKRGTSTINPDERQQPPRKRQTKASKTAEGNAEVPPLRSTGTSTTKRGVPQLATRKRTALKPPTPNRSSKTRPKRVGTPNTKHQPLLKRTALTQPDRPDSSAKKRCTLPPFGHVLDEATSPTGYSKENRAE